MAEQTRGEVHPRDTTSLILGLVLLAAGVLFLVADTTDADVDARWSAPIALVAIGLAGLLSALRPREKQDEVPLGAQEPGPASDR
ncbi:MAG: hypothetical protein Q8R60_19295 [Mycobacteriales bacterium]|nr:hypothetical protein [Mycobacteriales bacterium]